MRNAVVLLDNSNLVGFNSPYIQAFIFANYLNSDIKPPLLHVANVFMWIL